MGTSRSMGDVAYQIPFLKETNSNWKDHFMGCTTSEKLNGRDLEWCFNRIHLPNKLTGISEGQIRRVDNELWKLRLPGPIMLPQSHLTFSPFDADHRMDAGIDAAWITSILTKNVKTAS